MIVHIRHRDNPFVQIDKRALEDERLGWKAKGVLAYLLSRPPNWVVRTEQLVNIGPDGRVALQGAFRELRDCGYARLEQIRTDDQSKAAGKEWVIYEQPLTDTKPANQESRETENLTVRKPAPNKNEGQNDNDLLNENEIPLAPGGGEASSIQSKMNLLDGFAEFWAEYPRKVKKDKALAAWKRKRCATIREEIMLALAMQKTWPQWLKKAGQFIPHPTTWLNGGEWQNEGHTVDQPKAKEKRGF